MVVDMMRQAPPKGAGRVKGHDVKGRKEEDDLISLRGVSNKYFTVVVL